MGEINSASAENALLPHHHFVSVTVCNKVCGVVGGALIFVVYQEEDRNCVT